MSSASPVHFAAPSTQLTPRASTLFTLVACGLFVVLGIVTTLLGPILPLLSVHWSISIAQAGILFSWQFMSSVVGALLSGTVVAKRSFKTAVVLGIALCLVGVAALVTADWTLGRYAVGCYGFGLGLALPAINLAVAEINPARQAASVSILNFAWGIGAIAGPKLLRLAHDLTSYLMLVSGAVFIALVAACVLPMPARNRDQQPETAGSSSVWNLVPLLAISMFLYCGVESAISGWIATLALPNFANAYIATNANVAFWIFFLGGRAFAPPVLRRIREERFLLISILISAAGVVTFYFAHNQGAVLAACALAGAGIGPGFPLLIARVSELIGTQHPATTVCFAFAGIGAGLLSTFVGLLGARLGQPRAGLLLPLLALAALVPLARRLAAASTAEGLADKRVRATGVV